MTVSRAFTTVILSAVGFGLAGGLLGWLLGEFAPGYYRSVFARGDHPEFNPVQVGLGLGLTQGLMFGAVVGAIVVLAVAWLHRAGATGRNA